MLYDTLKKYIDDKKCTLITTEKEYIEQEVISNKYFVKINSLCGHENIVRADLFCYQDNGIYCKKCIPYIIANNSKNIKSLSIEHEGYIYVKQLLEPYMEIKKMVEGTKADFAIRLEKQENKWMPIQLKVTSKPKENRSNQYWFTIQHNYNMPILCICMSDKRVWLFPENILGKKNLQIGYNVSKYNKYEVSSNNIYETIQQIYDISLKYDINSLNNPESKSQQQEQYYRNIREKFYSNTIFDYPEQAGLAYDFIVNGLKFQEKVVCKQSLRLSGYICTFGRRKNKNTIIQYFKNDADYYWFHIPNTKIYYIIPENILIEKGYINDSLESKKAKSLTFYPITINGNNNKKWQNSYKYNYDDILDGKLCLKTI